MNVLPETKWEPGFYMAVFQNGHNVVIQDPYPCIYTTHSTEQVYNENDTLVSKEVETEHVRCIVGLSISTDHIGDSGLYIEIDVYQVVRFEEISKERLEYLQEINKRVSMSKDMQSALELMAIRQQAEKAGVLERTEGKQGKNTISEPVEVPISGQPPIPGPGSSKLQVQPMVPEVIPAEPPTQVQPAHEPEEGQPAPVIEVPPPGS